MAKITVNPITGSYLSVTAFNNAMQQIEDALNDNVLWRDGFVSEPNTMDNDLDMGGYQTLNLSAPRFENSPVRLSDLVAATGALAGTTTALLTTIDDSGLYYSASNVEAMGQEIGASLATNVLNIATNEADIAALPSKAETLSNKTMTSPTINTPIINTPTVNGVTGRGSEFFTASDIVSLVSSSSSSSVAWSTITDSTLTTNNATIAWIQISLSGYIISAAAFDSSYGLYLETSGLSGSVNAITQGPQFSGKVRMKTAGSVNETSTAENTWLVPVVLDGSSQFQWGSHLSSAVYTDFKLSIDLVGYEV